MLNVPLEDESPSLPPGELISFTPALGCHSLVLRLSFSNRNADVIIADSRFLFTSTSDSFTFAQQLINIVWTASELHLHAPAGPDINVDFESVLAMEHSGMVDMFRTLEDTELQGFLNATHSVYEAAVVEFFANTKVIAGTIETVIEMRGRFSGSDVPFRAPSKKKEMKMEFRMLHDIMAKALCAKAGFFDMVTSEKFDLMVAISAGLKADLGESVKLHPQKVLTSKSVATYVKKNLKVTPAGESSKQTKDTTSNTEGDV
ncbi:hypothetical protein F511_10247 [Dorcoceras hygrometricum]|uniref:Uncharacterized protein n=1 Tax=Dorcoceras hygrometricum TaxID=472368 RepID=A0A2Z7D1C8_9LAMI|nr:hypothetical protein F511_10247 [Dorcoceras hygrometricum]